MPTQGDRPRGSERFHELADRWEKDTLFLSRSDKTDQHPACREIISLGEPAVSLILERMTSQDGHWFHILQEITNADPVEPRDYGNIAAMQQAWLQWGRDNRYI